MSTTLVVTSSWPRTEDPIAGTFVRSDACARAREGEQVIVVAPIGPGVARAGDGVRVVEVAHGGLFGTPGAWENVRTDPRKIMGISRFVREVSRVLREARADRIVAHWIFPSGAIARAIASSPIESIAHGADVRLFEAMPKRLACAMLERIVEGATLRAVSTSLAERIASIAPSLARSIVVRPMPLAVDDANVRAQTIDRARALHRGLRPLHVVAARLVREKRIERAIDHVALRGGALVVVGEGPMRGALVDHARRARVAMEMLGARPHEEALAWIAAADVVLAPIAKGEGAPTVVREARALGREVITFEGSTLVTSR